MRTALLSIFVFVSFFGTSGLAQSEDVELISETGHLCDLTISSTSDQGVVIQLNYTNTKMPTTFITLSTEVYQEFFVDGSITPKPVTIESDDISIRKAIQGRLLVDGNYSVKLTRVSPSLENQGFDTYEYLGFVFNRKSGRLMKVDAKIEDKKNIHNLFNRIIRSEYVNCSF